MIDVNLRYSIEVRKISGCVNYIAFIVDKNKIFYCPGIDWHCAVRDRLMWFQTSQFVDGCFMCAKELEWNFIRFDPINEAIQRFSNIRHLQSPLHDTILIYLHQQLTIYPAISTFRRQPRDCDTRPAEVIAGMRHARRLAFTEIVVLRRRTLESISIAEVVAVHRNAISGAPAEVVILPWHTFLAAELVLGPRFTFWGSDAEYVFWRWLAVWSDQLVAKFVVCVWQALKCTSAVVVLFVRHAERQAHAVFSGWNAI